MPEYQLGFRRFLTGIYSHTSAHIAAAPLAHHLALQGSRFRYSHDSFSLPAHGIEAMLKESKMIMRFRNINGAQVQYHTAMEYLYRPKELSELCAYRFFSETRSMSLSMAEKEELEYFRFSDEHPLHTTDVLVYRTKPCVPVVSWNWLGTTRGFSTSLLATVNTTHEEYEAREEYCLRFMILFFPFRKMEDLRVDDHQISFAINHREHRFDSEHLLIADNIQNIHNSLASALTENVLTEGTVEVEDEEVIRNEAADDTDTMLEAMLQSIGGALASTGGTVTHTVESNELNPSFGDNGIGGCTEYPGSFEDLEDVIENMEQTDSGIVVPKPYNNGTRFTVPISQLNSLVMQRFLCDRPTELETLSDIPPPPRVEAKAIGSWESIIAWGKLAGLDPEQQTAFDVLAATYVLSFLNEAENDAEMTPYLKEQLGCLRRLSRYNASDRRPLRMFITGPPGAGKCKYYGLT